MKIKKLELEKYMIPCIIKSLFGVECLGCGFQRGFLLLLNGKFASAFQMYPAIYTTVLFLCLIGLHFTDKSRSYGQLLIVTAILNGLFMIVGYLYNHC